MSRRSITLFLLVLAGASCEINIENPGVDSDSGLTENNGAGTDMAGNNGTSGMNNGESNNGNNGGSDAGGVDLGRDDMGNPIANSVYPCSDDDAIAPERCQGGAEWDKYEDSDLIERGKYLTHHIAICVDCHTPIDLEGTSDCSAYPELPGRNCDALFAGFNLPFYDYDFDWAPDALGHVGVPNITPHPDGIGEWSPEQLRTAFTKGIRPEEFSDYPIMFPQMPYPQYAHMTVEDQDAVIAYLHSLDPIPSGDPPNGPYDREPQPADSDFAIMDQLVPTDLDGDGELDGILPASDDFMPAVTLDSNHPDYDEAMRGRYLAQLSCTHCHTPSAAPDPSWTAEETMTNYMFFERDKGMVGDTGNPFMYSTMWPEAMVYGNPDLTGLIRTQNLTAHPDGVADWTLDELIRSVNGYDQNNEPMCPPMPVDTLYSGITDEDKRAIALYLLNSEGRANDTQQFNCQPPI